MQASFGDFVIFTVYISLLSYYFYSPENAAGFDYKLYNELSPYSRMMFILCLLFSMRSYRRNNTVKITVISLIILYLIRSHLTIPLMRLTGIIWYPVRDGSIFSALFAFLFMFGLKNVMVLSSRTFKTNVLRSSNTIIVKPIGYAILLILLALLTQDSFNKFYNGQTNKVIFPNQMHLASTSREVEVLKSREEIPTLNSQLLNLNKASTHFYRIFAPEAVFVYLAGSLQDHKIRDAAIYESSISKSYKDFFDYTILRKTPLDNKDLKNILPHAVFTKHVLSGLNSYVGTTYNDVYIFSPEDAPYLQSQNIEFFWDLMQVKYLVIGSVFSKALEGFSDKENYRLLGSYPNLDLNVYEITKNKKYSRLGVLPLNSEQDFNEVMGKINSEDVDILKQVYEKVVYLDQDTKGFTLIRSQADGSRRYYEIDAKQKGILIEFESYNHYWRLKINGEKKDHYKAFRILLGMTIEPGTNKIEINYRVRHFKGLFILSTLVTLLYGFFLGKHIVKKS